MKSFILFITFIFSISFCFGQNERQLGVLESDTTWLAEIIPFPINFAPEIAYEGYEDLRFAKHWRDQSHEEFWTYTFAWHITSYETFNEIILERDIKYYYDGLMKAVNKKKEFEVPETLVLFITSNSNESDADFVGKLFVYDSFVTERMITLNIRVKVYQCQSKQSSTIVFKVSHQGFKHDIWNRFEEVKLKSDYCD